MKDFPTRWLSLYKAVESLLACWPAVKSYFVNRGEENCSYIMWKFVCEQENEITDDFIKASLLETYLQFMHHYMNIMSQPLLSLQSNSISSTKVQGIMVQLKTKLETRLDKQIFAALATRSINNGNMAKTEIQKFKKDALNVLSRTISPDLAPSDFSVSRPQNNACWKEI
jgi:hypothetical protein